MGSKRKTKQQPTTWGVGVCGCKVFEISHTNDFFLETIFWSSTFETHFWKMLLEMIESKYSNAY